LSRKIEGSGKEVEAIGYSHLISGVMSETVNVSRPF
jgi:hypothetical protein